jgi:hypothetical protein
MGGGSSTDVTMIGGWYGSPLGARATQAPDGARERAKVCGSVIIVLTRAIDRTGSVPVRAPYSEGEESVSLSPSIGG